MNYELECLGQFKTLATALTVTGLVDALKGPGPFTVFAPNEPAFAKLPVGTVETLLMPENLIKFGDILKYHVAPTKIMASDVLAMVDPAHPATLQGEMITVTNVLPVMMNIAFVIAIDVEATNGVVHAIDSVNAIIGLALY